MKIQLSDHFTLGKLFRFTLPSIVMMIVTSVYGVVDGLFVSNFVGKTPFAAVNFIFPVIMLLGSFGFLFGTGGSALVSLTMGTGDRKRANRLFSLITYVSVGVGVVISVLGIIFLRPLAARLGAEGELLDLCVIYGRILLAGNPFFMLQLQFQSFFVTAEKPQLGLVDSLIAGGTNMVLDALFIAVFDWGIVGAALATALSHVAGGLFPVIYFSRKNSSILRLTGCSFDGKALWKTCTNGSSELLSNLSMSLVNMLYNVQLMKYAGENGVAAYGVLMYVNMIFIGTFIGYSIGTAPVFGYHLGAENYGELRSLRRKSLGVIGVFSLVMLSLGQLLAPILSRMFVSYDRELMEMTLRGFRIFSFSFLFAGVAIFGSGFFTALNNGPVSAAISFLRTLVFEMAAILLLPLIWGVDGIWMSIVVAELMAAVASMIFMYLLRKRYKY